MMTNGPNARIGQIMQVDIPRPRTRKALLEHPSYYRYRRELLDFLEAYEHGAVPKGQRLPGPQAPRPHNENELFLLERGRRRK